MDDRSRDGLILLGVGIVGLVGLFAIGTALPWEPAAFESTPRRARLGNVAPIIPWLASLAFFTLGATTLLGIYPGWGFGWSQE